MFKKGHVRDQVIVPSNLLTAVISTNRRLHCKIMPSLKRKRASLEKAATGLRKIDKTFFGNAVKIPASDAAHSPSERITSASLPASMSATLPVSPLSSLPLSYATPLPMDTCTPSMISSPVSMQSCSVSTTCVISATNTSSLPAITLSQQSTVSSTPNLSASDTTLHSAQSSSWSMPTGTSISVTLTTSSVTTVSSTCTSKSSLLVASCSTRTQATAVRCKQKVTNAGHKVGFQECWRIGRPWLQSIIDSGGNGGMVCQLCQEGLPRTGAKKVWIDVCCRTLRKDKVLEHECSAMHQLAVKTAVMRQEMTAASSQQKTSAQNIVEDALRIVCFIVEHNLALHLFRPLVQLITSLGAPNVKKMHVGQNATYTSWDSIQSFLTVLADQVKSDILDGIKASPSYAIMADEVCDVTSDKHLALVCRYMTPAANVSTALINDVVIPNGTANTIVAAVRKELAESGLDPAKMSAFGSDGASTFSGKKSGVGVQLKEINPAIIFQHCRDHRLALACKDSFKHVKIIEKTDDLLNNLHKYYKYSTVHNANLKSVQSALGQPQLKIKLAKHHRWLSHSQAVSSLVRTYSAVVTDLEQHTITADAAGNGLLKQLKDPSMLRCLLLLADVLPELSGVSMFFQKNDVHLGMVEATVDRLMKKLHKRIDEDGVHLRKFHQMTEAVDISRDAATAAAEAFDSGARRVFLQALIGNISARCLAKPEIHSHRSV